MILPEYLVLVKVVLQLPLYHRPPLGVMFLTQLLGRRLHRIELMIHDLEHAVKRLGLLLLLQLSLPI